VTGVGLLNVVRPDEGERVGLGDAVDGIGGGQVDEHDPGGFGGSDLAEGVP
jgi:hypothetical protein